LRSAVVVPLIGTLLALTLLILLVAIAVLLILVLVVASLLILALLPLLALLALLVLALVSLSVVTHGSHLWFWSEPSRFGCSDTARKTVKNKSNRHKMKFTCAKRSFQSCERIRRSAMNNSDGT
jgi:uncharacterized protein (DUF58 family)